MRLDLFLVSEGYFQSRSKAKEAIANGKVKVDGKLAKASFSLKGTEKIEVIEDKEQFVGRGGFKLLHALRTFEIVCTGCRALDIGASTGGFTDCLLQHGAKEVVAVDVGQNQLVPKLREDSRVISLEKTNIKDLEPLEVGKFDIITIDVSFISLGKFFYQLPGFMTEKAQIVALIKPQFEAGPKNIGKNGIVKDPKIHLKVIENVRDFALNAGLYTWGITYSPIKGGSGNIEFLGWFKMQENTEQNVTNLKSIVDKAHMQVIGTY